MIRKTAFILCLSLLAPFAQAGDDPTIQGELPTRRSVNDW